MKMQRKSHSSKKENAASRIHARVKSNTVQIPRRLGGGIRKKNKDPSVQVNSSVKLNGSCHNRFGILYKAGEEEGGRVSYGEFVSIGREECRNLS